MSRFWDSNPTFLNQVCIEALNRMRAIDQLKQLFVDKPTVEIRRRSQIKIQWFQPKLICEVAFAERTDNEQLAADNVFRLSG